MILLGLWILALLGMCYLAGRVGLHALRLVTWGVDEPGLTVCVLVGLALITGLACLASLFFPLGAGAAAGLLAAVLGITALEHGLIRQDLARLAAGVRQTPAWVLVLGASLFAVLLYKGSDIPINYDTGLYHAQAMRWIETYPAVPGLGNFADRLAFDSAWLVFSALVSGAGLGSIQFHAPGAVLYTVLILEGCSRLGRLLCGEIRAGHVLAVILLVLGRRLFSLEFSSPGTDMPASLLIWLTLLIGLDLVEERQTGWWNARHIVILWASVLAVTVKLSALPVLLLPLGLLLRPDAVKKFRPGIISVAILLILPWLARNVILSGYLAYPFPQVDGFRLDWKIPPEKARETQAWISAWARLPDQNPDAVMAMPLGEWLPQWWAAQDPFDWLLVSAAVAAWLGLAARLVIRRHRLDGIDWAMYRLLALTAWAGTVFWFVQAPAFRFGYGFLGILLGYPLAVLIAALLKRISSHWQRIGLYAFLVGFLLYQLAGLAGMRNLSEWRSRWLIPAGYPEIETQAVKQNNFTYNFPVSGNQCWDAPVPCTPFPNEQAWLRGESIREGFFIRKP